MLPLFAHSRHVTFPPVFVYGFGAIFGKITAIEPLKISRSLSDRVDYELKENLEAVENFKGSRDEKLVILYCKQLGINYKNLSEEEFRWFIRILKKSKKMGTPISQRKKR